MREAWISGAQALRERLLKPEQVAATEPEAGMPPYMESFLAHLRLLIGVPFEYLIPDARLLPDESIRFFYLDRSWTDRLVDGAVAVGKIGTREQAHHQAHGQPISQRLDLTERLVRRLQGRRDSFSDLKEASANDTQPAAVITGFLLRSAAVSGWSHMDVRAYRAGPSGGPPEQLFTLRLERLSPAVLLALFEGEPQRVVLEEPHHGIQFGVRLLPDGELVVDLRQKDGQPINDHVSLPVRPANNRVIDVIELRKRLQQKKADHSDMPDQTGSAAFALEVLDLPWQQRFEGTTDDAKSAGRFVPFRNVAQRVQEQTTVEAVQELINR
jgi:hypothetical protein